MTRLTIYQGRWPVVAGVFVLGALVFVPVASVRAQSDMESRLSRMERDIETMSRTVYKGEQPPPGTVIGSGAPDQMTADRVGQLERDLRDLTGRVEEQGNTLNQIKLQLDRALSDLQLRVGTLEQKLGLAPAATAPVATPAPVATTPYPDVPPPAATAVDPNAPASAASSTVQPLGSTVDEAPPVAASSTVSSDPTQSYENAMALLKQRDYVVAEKSLEDFIKAYPKHDLAQNAKYWLGEAYFAQNKFDKAARIFAEGYQQYPKGPKAPDNLLKLGLSLSAQGDKDGACVALTQIGKDYPTGANAVNTRAKAEIKKLKCQ